MTTNIVSKLGISISKAYVTHDNVHERFFNEKKYKKHFCTRRMKNKNRTEAKHNKTKQRLQEKHQNKELFK